jgi:subfamily B ATP-binding cassette protein HlyB/CyaB
MLRGEIVEVGGHEELLERKDGLYARLWALQSDQARVRAPA